MKFGKLLAAMPLFLTAAVLATFVLLSSNTRQQVQFVPVPVNNCEVLQRRIVELEAKVEAQHQEMRRLRAFIWKIVP